MRSDIDYQWKNLETKRLNLISELSKFDNVILNTSPAPSAWSVLQVIQHIMVTEGISLAYITKKLSYKSDIPKAGLNSKLRRLALSFIFTLPFKYKAPQILDFLPEITNMQLITAKWTAQRLDFYDFLDKMPDNVLDSEIWRHQIVGKMNISQMIDFFDSHFDRHQKQIEKTLNIVTANI